MYGFYVETYCVKESVEETQLRRGLKRKAIDEIEFERPPTIDHSETIFQNLLHEDLISDCKAAAEDGKSPPVLSSSVRHRLELCDEDVRKEIVSRPDANRTPPIFYSCMMGNIEITKYLLTHCNANSKQIGPIICGKDAKSYMAPVLFLVTAAKNLPLIKLLVSHGADINAFSQCGITSLQLACIEHHDLEILKFFLDNGGDVNLPFRSGSTCLIRSVTNLEKCSLLLEYEAEVNAKSKHNSYALHSAILRRNYDTTKLLLSNNANPFLKNDNNDDALQIACITKQEMIFQYLLNNVKYSYERVLNAFLLIGSTLVYHKEPAIGVQYWRIAAAIRNALGIPLEKKSSTSKKPVFNNVKEFETMEELSAILMDADAILEQSFIIYQRVLGMNHVVTLNRLVAQAKHLKEIDRFEDCLHLWGSALELLVEKNNNITDLPYTTIEALKGFITSLHTTWYFTPEMQVKFEHVESLFTSLIALFSNAQKLVEAIPDVQSKLKKRFESMRVVILIMIHLLLGIAQSDEQNLKLRYAVRQMIIKNPRQLLSDPTMIQICIIGGYLGLFGEDISSHLIIIKLLLECGIDVHLKNEFKSTALHIACTMEPFYEPLAKLLLDHGAQLGAADIYGTTPSDMLARLPLKDIYLMRYITCKSLAAQAVVRYGVKTTELPTNCIELIRRLE